MKNKSSFCLIKKFVFLLAFFAALESTLAQTPGVWETWGPIIGEPRITVLLADSTDLQIIYAGTRHGVYRSTDFGLTWQQANAPMNDKIVATLVSVDGTLYAGTDGNGVFRSVDGGINWTEANAGLIGRIVTAMISVGGTLYVGMIEPGFITTPHGIFYSTDGGINWTQAKAPIQGKYVTTLISVNGTLYAGTKEGVFRSIDGGVNWMQANAPMNDKNVTTLISVNGTLYAGTGGIGVFRSRDGGINWTQAEAPMKDKKVTALISVAGTIYAGTDSAGVLWSMDGGVNWTQAKAPMNSEPVTTLISEDGTLNAGTLTNGVFRSVDGGINWTQANAPMNDQNVTTLISADEALFIGTDEGVFRSTDHGMNWFGSSRDLLPHANCLGLIVNLNFILAHTSNSGVFRSTDGGVNWMQASAPMNDKNVTILISVNGILYAGTDGQGVFRSTDGGVNWTQANAPMQDNSVNTMISVDGALYAGTDQQGVFRSTDDGVNWTQANAPMKNQRVVALVSVAGIIYASTEPAYVFRSIDGGINWTQVRARGDFEEATTIFSVDQTLYLGTKRVAIFELGVFGKGGVFRSNDGLNWYPLRTEMGEGKDVYQFAYLPSLNRLYAATSNGVYFQKLDHDAPIADSIQINSGKQFTQTDNATITLYAKNADADSMILAQDENFSVKNTGWKKYDLVYRYLLFGDDGSKTVYAKFKDISYNESKVVSAKITLDENAPEFQPHTPPTTANLTNSVKINQRVTEPNLDKMLLYYRRGGEPFSEDRLVSFRTDTARIDGVFITNRGIDYRIFALDRAGNDSTLQNGTLDFFSIPVELGATEAGSSPGFPAGTGGSSYRLVSVPMKLNNTPSVKSALGIRGKYGKDDDWRFWIYQGNEQWREGDNIPLQNGEGYFLILRNGGTLTNKVAGTTMETTAGVLGTISGWRVRANDWTIIGNPYNTRIELSQLNLKGQDKILSAPEMSASVWMYEGSSSKQGWTNEGIALERWSGLAIYSTREDTIVFTNSQDPYAKGLSKSSSPLTENLQENEWLVQIHAEIGDYADNVNYFGVRKEASAEQDVYDWYEPPSVPGGISVNFPHAEWSHSASFTSDIRPISKDGYKWQIRVNASGGTAVTLNFKQLETVPNSFEALLLDESSHLLRDLRTQPQVEVRIPQESDMKNLAILVGKQDFVQSHTAGMRTIPQSFALHQNYPNPFNPSTVIRYELPVAGKVTLKLYNLLGTEVTTLENDEPREPGFYEKVVDLINFASGIYFYRISVSGEKQFEMTKKMVMAK